ncbi:MAG: hypothetical protein OQK82_03200, partial [Candidatus Pacearchaeota archaeon]|nr:hypothetical protein [Candidatus Pacearchaeota archaeon]
MERWLDLRFWQGMAQMTAHLAIGALPGLLSILFIAFVSLKLVNVIKEKMTLLISENLKRSAKLDSLE